jgi:hypothetical protein
MGYAPSGPPPPPLNLDRFGMPRDYATYIWLLYRRRVVDDSPPRRAFLNRGRDSGIPDFGQQLSMR